MFLPNGSGRATSFPVCDSDKTLMHSCPVLILTCSFTALECSNSDIDMLRLTKRFYAWIFESIPSCFSLACFLCLMLLHCCSVLILTCSFYQQRALILALHSLVRGEVPSFSRFCRQRVLLLSREVIIFASS